MLRISRLRINEPICEYNFAKFRDWKPLILKINDLPTYIYNKRMATRQCGPFALLMKFWFSIDSILVSIRKFFRGIL